MLGHLKVAATLVGAMRTRLYVDADHGLAQRAQGFEAGVAKFETELVFAFCVEGAVTFVAGGVRRALALFSHVDFRMDFERVHNISPTSIGACRLPEWDICMGCREMT